MECNNIIRLKCLKLEFIERLDRVNYLIKHADRTMITINTIREAQLIRDYLGKDINICNSLLSNMAICSMNIDDFLKTSNFHITDIDKFLKIVERLSH